MLKSFLSSRHEESSFEIPFLDWKKIDWELLALLASFLGKNASWGQPCVWKLSLKEQLGFPPGKQVKGKFPLQGHFKTKAKISIWLMTSPPQLWKSSNIRRLVAAAEFGVTSVGADVGEVQPDTQMGAL